MLRLLCAIVESPRRHKHVPFVNIAFLHSRSIKRRQWKHKLDYYGIVFAHLVTRCGIKAKYPLGLDSDRWIPHSRCCENPARAKALTGFSRHLSAGFTDLNPALRGFSLYAILRVHAATWQSWAAHEYTREFVIKSNNIHPDTAAIPHLFVHHMPSDMVPRWVGWSLSRTLLLIPCYCACRNNLTSRWRLKHILSIMGNTTIFADADHRNINSTLKLKLHTTHNNVHHKIC